MASGRRRLIWFPADDQPPLDLTDHANGYVVQWSMTGFMRPTYRISTRPFPGRAGSVLQSVVAGERTLEVGMAVIANSRVEFLSRARTLIRRLNPHAGPGRLVVIEHDGTSRYIEALCTEGPEGAESPSSGGRDWWIFTLSFLAPDPYARSEPLEIPWSLSPTVSGWFPEIPIRLDASGVGGRQVVHNPGDVEAFPVITVHGPGTALEVVNRTTGKGLHLNYSIPAGGTVTIDTRPGEQTIRDGYGVNLFASLTDEDPSLWSLQPGDNEIDVKMGAATSASRVTVRFEPLYESL